MYKGLSIHRCEKGVTIIFFFSHENNFNHDLPPFVQQCYSSFSPKKEEKRNNTKNIAKVALDIFFPTKHMNIVKKYFNSCIAV